MLLLCLSLLSFIAIATAQSAIIASGSVLHSAKVTTRINGTWSFPHKTTSSRSVNTYQASSPTPLPVTSALFSESSELPKASFQSSKTASVVQTVRKPNEGALKGYLRPPPPGFGPSRNQTRHSNGTWTFANRTVTSHITPAIGATRLPPFKNNTSKTNQTQTTHTLKYFPTGSLQAPYLNTSATNTTWAFSAKNVSAPVASDVAPSFRLAGAAAAAAPVVHPRAVFAHFMVFKLKRANIRD